MFVMIQVEKLKLQTCQPYIVLILVMLPEYYVLSGLNTGDEYVEGKIFYSIFQFILCNLTVIC